ncbi:MAG: hypothetical protein ACTSXP_13820 [Promethearchaeota archaeon]
MLLDANRRYDVLVTSNKGYRFDSTLVSGADPSVYEGIYIMRTPH